MDARAADGWAQAYLEARARTANDKWVEVMVLRDTISKQVICYGPPESWPAGAAMHVLNDVYMLDVLRCEARRPWPVAEERPAENELSDEAADAPSRIAFKGRRSFSPGGLARLKVGVHAHRGGCAYMEDEAVVHITPKGDAAFVCVYDGHGGGEASNYCKEVSAAVGRVSGIPWLCRIAYLRRPSSSYLVLLPTGTSLQCDGNRGVCACHVQPESRAG